MTMRSIPAVSSRSATRRAQVGPADRVLVAAVDLAVGERLQAGVGQLDTELLGDLPAQLATGPAGRDHEPLLVAGRDARGRHQLSCRLEGRAHFESSSTRSA